MTLAPHHCYRLWVDKEGSHPRVEAYGTLDELNAALSLCCACPLRMYLIEAIQQLNFLVLAPGLASDSGSHRQTARYISGMRISHYQASAIDRAMARVEPLLASFILPGRCGSASRLFAYARWRASEHASWLNWQLLKSAYVRC